MTFIVHEGEGKSHKKLRGCGRDEHGLEATLATDELELRYANISTVDNYAHGIVEEPLAYKDIIEAASKSRADVERVLVKVVEGI